MLDSLPKVKQNGGVDHHSFYFLYFCRIFNNLGNPAHRFRSGTGRRSRDERNPPYSSCRGFLEERYTWIELTKVIKSSAAEKEIAKICNIICRYYIVVKKEKFGVWVHEIETKSGTFNVRRILDIRNMGSGNELVEISWTRSKIYHSPNSPCRWQIFLIFMMEILSHDGYECKAGSTKMSAFDAYEVVDRIVDKIKKICDGEIWSSWPNGKIVLKKTGEAILVNKLILPYEGEGMSIITTRWPLRLHGDTMAKERFLRDGEPL